MSRLTNISGKSFSERLTEIQANISIKYRDMKLKHMNAEREHYLAEGNLERVVELQAKIDAYEHNNGIEFTLLQRRAFA